MVFALLAVPSSAARFAIVSLEMAGLTPVFVSTATVDWVPAAEVEGGGAGSAACADRVNTISARLRPVVLAMHFKIQLPVVFYGIAARPHREDADHGNNALPFWIRVWLAFTSLPVTRHPLPRHDRSCAVPR